MPVSENLIFKSERKPNMSEPQKPNNAREMLEVMQADLRTIKSALAIPDGSAPGQQLKEDPTIPLVSSILTVMQDIQTSQEMLHRRLDAVVRHIPAASR